MSSKRTTFPKSPVKVALHETLTLKLIYLHCNFFNCTARSVALLPATAVRGLGFCVVRIGLDLSKLSLAKGPRMSHRKPSIGEPTAGGKQNL